MSDFPKLPEVPKELRGSLGLQRELAERLSGADPAFLQGAKSRSAASMERLRRESLRSWRFERLCHAVAREVIENPHAHIEIASADPASANRLQRRVIEILRDLGVHS